MMNTPLIVANWKMHTTLADAHVLVNGIRNQSEHMEKIEIVVCPPSIWLALLAHDGIVPRSLSHLKLGAQNMYFEEEGPFTGEISPAMVKEVAEYVIVGHSERVHVFKEDAEMISNKVRAAFDHNLVPIVCLGEEERSDNSRRQMVHRLNHLIRDVRPGDLERIVVAYEPVWAIGSGHPATPEYAQEVISGLRGALTSKTRILYGGSVDEKDARGFLEQRDIDGLLVGGSSLRLKTFLTICQMADDLA